MTSLDRESIEELARGAIDALRGGSKDDGVLDEATAGVRQQYDRMVDVIRKEYSQTRQTARGQIHGFLSNGKVLPKANDVIADIAAVLKSAFA